MSQLGYFLLELLDGQLGIDLTWLKLLKLALSWAFFVPRIGAEVENWARALVVLVYRSQGLHVRLGELEAVELVIVRID